ncbi:MAG: two-component hybrid sensor and regulator [Fibrobacteres bacterium]|nr:two-component hybrid sensor and regulator [Fibrobacterota bacterium]
MGIKAGIINVFSRAFGMGAENASDPRHAKRIVLSNQISISIALLSLPYVVIYMMNGAGMMGWLEIPIFLGYASVHRFNKAGFTLFSRLWLLTLANLDILIYTVSMGKSLGLHVFYLACGSAPLVLFDAEERKSILYGVGLSTLLFLGTEALAPEAGLFAPIAGSMVHRLRVLEMATLVLVQILLMVYFLIGNRRTEIALARTGEAAKAADEAKSRFLAKMSGEIRAPLDEILGASHLLSKSGLGPERRETLEDIQMSAQDLMNIVDEILDLSRIESGKMRLESAPFSPVRLGHAVLRPFEFESGRKNLDLSLESDPDLPPHLLGDAARIKQVLRNLLGNAFKFTETGSVVLRIRSAGGEGAAHRLEFEIEDTGIGVPEEARQRIFEPFSQADSSTSRKYGGTGLGLFISKQIVELMGGSIGFRPRSEGGTVFHFSLPLVAVAEHASPAMRAFATVRTPSGRTLSGRTLSTMDIPSASFNPGSKALPRDTVIPASASALRILIVDDHSLNRKVLVSFLATYDLTADLAATAEEALSSYAVTAYHLVFMDCHMPGMDGYECTRLMRLGPRPGGRPTIIGVTADAMENNLRRCLDAGMDSLLVKPIIEKQLRGLIAECASRLPSGPGAAGA